MHIAIVDDDVSQTELTCKVLTAAGHTCHPFRNGGEALAAARRDGIDMLIVDQSLLSTDEGILPQRMREVAGAGVPVLLIASRDSMNSVGSVNSENNVDTVDSIVTALEAGVQDYIVKPLRRPELLLRINVLLRRAYPERCAVERLHFGQYIFEPGTGRVSMAGHEISVTQKEFELALLFFRNLGRPLSRAYILDAVWTQDGEVSSRTMDTHVSRVRNKLHLKPEHGFRLAPVYSYGYRLEELTK